MSICLAGTLDQPKAMFGTSNNSSNGTMQRFLLYGFMDITEFKSQMQNEAPEGKPISSRMYGLGNDVAKIYSLAPIKMTFSDDMNERYEC